MSGAPVRVPVAEDEQGLGAMLILRNGHALLMPAAGGGGRRARGAVEAAALAPLGCVPIPLPPTEPLAG
jgi:hypothetical protein